MVNVPDVYFLPKWGECFAEKEQDGVQRVFELNHEAGHVYYQFILRTIPQEPDGKQYFDIITPFGFSGPVVLDARPGRLDELLELFDAAFQEYCDKHKIVTEYIRFSPWLENLSHFQKIYETRNQGTTLYIDLTVDDFFMEEFSSTARRQIRRAQKNNVHIEFDHGGSTMKEFHRLYELTAKKQEMDDYYLFSKKFLQDSFQKLNGKTFLLNAIHEGKYVSSCWVIHYGEHMHYHLMANDPEYYHLAANSLILHEGCNWGVANAKTKFHLGGTGGDENLERFKRRFTKTEPLDYFVGKKIRNQTAYDILVQHKEENGGIKDAGFFPLYRGSL